MPQNFLKYVFRLHFVLDGPPGLCFNELKEFICHQELLYQWSSRHCAIVHG